MKIKYIKTLGLFTLLASFSLGSCNDDFLEEKQDYNGVNEEVFKVPALAKQYVDYVYNMFLPANNAQVFTWDIASGGNDDFSQTSPELGGEVTWNKAVSGTITSADVNCLQYLGAPINSSVNNNTWTRLREINIFLEEIDKNGMAAADKDPLKGQMYFWRAWQYFDLLKFYGGVPIVLTAQNPIVDDATLAQVPRSSSSECLEQILSDLDKAQELLPGKWSASADWGRITSGAAAAFKGRVLLTWASPLFNRNDDVARWQRAYDANTEAKALLESAEGGAKGLFSTGGFADGVAWGNMWFSEVNNKEAVIVYGFNKSSVSDAQRNNGWERAVRSRAAGGNGSISPTKQMVDAFPMADGKSIVGNASYSPVLFYKNRDPRFYKTFAYNGATWKYAENTAFKQWTYSWYKTGPTVDAPNPDKFTEATPNSSGIYVRKATNETASNASSFQYSGTDYMEMRFAEVVLNLAESAIGINKLSEGKTLIESIRNRAGITNGDGHYGLAAVSSRDEHFAAVLNERKIEFAYENKLFYDLRRWLLFDNTYGTCSRLGIAPLNGTRRTGYYIVAKKTDGNNYIHASVDPFVVNSAGVAPIVNREPAFPYTIPATGKNPGTVINNEKAYLDYMYTNYFDIVERDNLDPTANNSSWKFTWYDQYYFFGIHQNLINVAPYLEQTKGWGGTFDPLQ
jgi:starch-binding outer membrane protein, SusD/RagB family